MFDWNNTAKQFYHSGLDRGVLYKAGEPAVPWRGLVAFDEAPEGGGTELYYRDGEIFLADAEPSDFKAQLNAISFPDEFSECVGIPAATEGFYVDNQKPKRFDLSYRTLVGSGAEGDLFGHQIHLVYNGVAAIGNRNRRTLSKETALTEFTFDIVCTPVKLTGYRPTAHYVIDTRGISTDMVTTLERILYGIDPSEAGISEFITEPLLDLAAEPARLPTPQELYDLISSDSP